LEGERKNSFFGFFFAEGVDEEEVEFRLWTSVYASGF